MSDILHRVGIKSSASDTYQSNLSSYRSRGKS